MKKIEVEILSCGSSSGVPAIGNYWGDCNPNNQRTEVEVFNFNKKSKVDIIDATPDLRQQLLNAKVKYLDAVLITRTC